MRCPRCNAQLADNASFCGICGNALSAAPLGNVQDGGPSINDEATMMAPWSGGQLARGSQEAGSPMQANQLPMPAASAWASGQPGAFQPPLAGAGSQTARAGWSSAPVGQPQAAMVPGMQPGNLHSAASALPARKRRSAGRVWARVLLVLVLLLAILSAVWFLGVRPYVHNLAQTELDQALSAPESQLQLAMLALPSGSQEISASENTINTYLSSHDNDQIQNLRMSILPTGMILSFTAYGQDCSITALPIVTNGLLQVTNVRVQGVLALIMSSDELTGELDDNLQTFSNGMTHKIAQITLLDQKIKVQFR